MAKKVLVEKSKAAEAIRELPIAGKNPQMVTSSEFKSISTRGWYILAIIVIVMITTAAALYDSEQSTAILALGGALLTAFLALINGNSEIHSTFNSKMDKFLELVETASIAKGRKEVEDENVQKAKDE